MRHSILHGSCLTRLPRLGLHTRILPSDWILFGIVILGSLSGAKEFPDFLEAVSVSNNLSPAGYWTTLFLIFNLFYLYRKVRRSFLHSGCAYLYVLIIHFLVSFVIWIAISFTPSLEHGLIKIAATQLCAASFYMLLQSWVDFKPDLLEISQLADEIHRCAINLSHLNESEISSVAVARLSLLCQRLIALAEDSCQQLWKNPDEQKMLLDLRDKVNQIRLAAKSPSGAIAASLRRIL